MNPVPITYSEVRNYLLRSPGAWANNMYLYARTGAEFDVSIFAQALNAAVARHRALRARYMLVNGQLTKEVYSKIEIPLRAITVNSEGEELELVRQEIGYYFQLESEPLLRVNIITRGNTIGILLVISHMIFDATSAKILVAELAKFYGSFKNGLPTTDQPLPLTMENYAAWERNWVQGETAQRFVDFWKERLGRGIPMQRQRVILTRAFAVTPGLPPGNDVPSPMRMIRFDVKSSVLTQLKRLGNETKLAVSVIAISALMAVLIRRSSASVVSLGQLLDLRNAYAALTDTPEMHKVVGCLYNVLFFSVPANRQMTLRELMLVVDSELEAVTEHAALPLVPLLTRREENEAFRVVCSYVRSPASLRLPGLSMEDVPRELVESGIWKTKSDNNWIIHETSNGLYGYLNTNSALWTDETAHELAEEYVQTIERFVTEPDSQLG